MACQFQGHRKYLPHLVLNWLEKNEYQKYLDTYFGGNVDDAWDAVLSMCEMFDQTAKKTACVFGYGYDAEEGIAAFTFLKHVRNLPMDATDIGHIGR